MNHPILSVQEAETLIDSLVTPFASPADTEAVGLLQGVGRILATAATSALDFPHWDNSAMDGYAVRHEDIVQCSPDQPVDLEVIEEIAAGTVPQQGVRSGQAARIFTGAIVPPGADTIVMQENTQPSHLGDRHIAILQTSPPQGFIRVQGTYYQAGQPLLSAGIRLQATDLAILAALQCSPITVYRRPRVAILSTGDELVAIDQPLKPGQIVDSNHYALAALVQQMRAEVILIGMIPDDPRQLKQAITQACQQADVVLSSGGVSVGDYDYVDQILQDLGATLHLRAIAMKPGKPLTVATFPQSNRSILYFGLPGNPVSSLVTFWRFVQPAIAKLSGLKEGYGCQFVEAVTDQDLKAGGDRETYLPGHLVWQPGGYRFRLAGGNLSSGNLIHLAQINGLAMLTKGTRQVMAGASIPVLQILMS
jgi:molybdopterin molybdotransferase